MPTYVTPWKTAGNGFNSNTGGNAWSDVTKITADDGDYASVTAGGVVSDTLIARYFYFDLRDSVDSIDGIEVIIERQDELGNTVYDGVVRMWVNSVLTGEDKAGGAPVSYTHLRAHET